MSSKKRFLGLILAAVVSVFSVLSVNTVNARAASKNSLVTLVKTKISSITASKKNTINYSTMNATTFMKYMGMGWNLGNSLDAASDKAGYTLDTETLWGNPKVTAELLKSVKNAGFSTVRIPVTYYNHIDAKGNIDSAWLNRVEQVVNYALSNNLYVIINVHHDTGMNDKYRWIYADKEHYETDAANLAKLWKQIATKFMNYDERLIFEAANEIEDVEGNYMSPDNSAVVHDLNQVFITTVRSVGGKNKTRFLGLATYSAGTQTEQTIGALDGGYTDVVKDKLMLAFHCYKDNESDIMRVVYRVYSNAKKYNIPVYIGEFGAKSSVSDSTRMEIAKTFNTLCNEYGICSMWWDNGTDYALFDRNTYAVLYPELVKAITSK